MVKDSRTPARADQLRPLNPPLPLHVLAHNDLPVAIIAGNDRIRIERIEDTWQIDDEWWREPVQRRYYRVLLATGAMRTIYHDLIHQTWSEQSY